MEIQKVQEGDATWPSLFTVAVSVNGSKNSSTLIKWALDKFASEGRIFIKILHIRPRVTMVPTPMGNYIPISKVRDEVASAYKIEMEWKTSKMLLPYWQMCAQRQVEAEVVVIEADDVADAIAGEIAKFSIRKLVVGASSQSIFTRKHKGDKLSARISACAPTLCTVYIVSKGKLSSVREATPGIGESIEDRRNDSSIASSCLSSPTSSGQSEWTDANSASKISRKNTLLTVQRSQALKMVNQNFLYTRLDTSNVHHSRRSSLGMDEDVGSSVASCSEIRCVNTTSSYGSCQMDSCSLDSDGASTSNEQTDSSPIVSQVGFSYELERLRIGLRHLRGMCEMVQNEAVDASQQLNELSQFRMEETYKLEEMSSREKKARELARQEKERRSAAEREAEFVRQCADREVMHRMDAEKCASYDVEEKQRLEKALTGCVQQYKKVTWEEIICATSSLSDICKIGMGANGIVYKGNLHHTVVAIKVLHSNEAYRTKQFKQELKILSSICHPHLLLLLGACLDRGCLVYEYMGNGSLEDRLQRKDDTPSLPWFDRYRIAWEVTSALVFLHNSKPKPIIHRDLKPANILLDHNYVSKIGDVGLSTMLPTQSTLMSTMYKDTALVGTLCYIDPEYQRTGMVSPKSDVYALGMVILQLLTAKSPMGLTHIVETALEDGCLADILDSGAGKWPAKETQELALLGLSCAELRRKDRPDLQIEVLPLLERLKDVSAKACDSVRYTPSAPPSHFICPILQEVMGDPCVAADGYSYDRKAIETWLSMKDKSPMTNLQLPNKKVIPNHSLLSAIKDWKSRNH